MKKTLWAAMPLMTMAGLLMASAQDTGERKMDAKTEVRVFLLDKSGNPVDLKDITAQIIVTPAEGDKKTVDMVRVDPKTKMPGDTPKETPKDTYKDTPKDKETPQAKAHDMKKEHMVCGQVKDLDPYYVELIVLPEGHARMGATHEKGKTDADRKEWKDWEKMGKGFLHDHGATYFKAELDRAFLTGKGGRWVNFDADVAFIIRGDKRTVKNFEYPEGLWYDSMSRLIDNEFKTLKDDARSAEHAKMVGERVRRTVEALPPLAFKSEEDRMEWEKARRDCLDTCHRLETATAGQNVADLAKECKTKCETLRSEAKDAQGVLMAE